VRRSNGGSIWLLAALLFLAAPHLANAGGSFSHNGPPARRFPTPAPSRAAAHAVTYALAQRGKPYQWGAEGPDAYDCSGLTWRAWRAAGVAIPRTAADQLAGLPRVHGRLRPGDLVVYRTNGPSRRHVAMVVGRGRMVEARGRGIPVQTTGLRRGWLGVVRPGGR
jgi:cell wall-associated NlpC family hydrolase